MKLLTDVYQSDYLRLRIERRDSVSDRGPPEPVCKGPFTLSRIASRIIPDLNPWCSGVRHHDFFSMPVWIRSELGVYTGNYGVSTDRQGSNADHAGNAYGANTDFKEEHGGYWVLLRSLHGGVRCLLGYLRNVDG